MAGIPFVAMAALGAMLCVSPALAQTPFQYREYALGSTVASVVKTAKTREDGTKTVHERPSRIQELEWRAPYVSPGTELADPVRDIVFSFCDDQLYQVVVTYDRQRMEGLTNDDVIESISATYGTPLLRRAAVAQKTLPVLPSEPMVVAQWENAASLLTLTRDSYSPQFHLVLISKTLDPIARAAIAESRRLDTLSAPQRAQEQRTKDVADTLVANQKARVANKAAFKP
jgi:hypothetical protein